MIKKAILKKIVPLCLAVCMISSMTVSAYSGSENHIGAGEDRLDAIFEGADRVEETKDGKIYFFDDVEGSILKNTHNNITTLTIKEKGKKDNIVEVDKDDKISLNGESVVITYEEIEQGNENVITPRLTTRYYESDSGNSSAYTVLGKTEKVANIYFESTIGGLTTTVILGVIGAIIPGIAFTASVAVGIATAFGAYNTKNLSCIVKHYYQKGWTGGWYMGSFGEKIVTTWYSQVNYKGKSTVTTHYRTGISY